MYGRTCREGLDTAVEGATVACDKPTLRYLVAFSRDIASYMAGDSVSNLLHAVIPRLIFNRGSCIQHPEQTRSKSSKDLMLGAAGEEDVLQTEEAISKIE